jgi:hypothetical protein
MLSGSQVEAGNLVFHKFSMQSFTLNKKFPIFQSNIVKLVKWYGLKICGKQDFQLLPVNHLT